MSVSDQMIARELQSQDKQWGLRHDVDEHGSSGLAGVAGLLIERERPSDLDDCHDWIVELWDKHANDLPRRYAIAAAMLRNAIECFVYEQGRGAVCKPPESEVSNE